MHLRVGIERCDLGEQFALSGFCGQAVFETVKACFFRLNTLVAHIDFTRRIIADEDDRQSGLHAGLRTKRGTFLRDFGANFCGKGFAINDFCAHVSSFIYKAAAIAAAVSRNSFISAGPCACAPSVLPSQTGIRCIW